MHTRMYMYTYVYIYMYLYRYVYIYIYMYTNKETGYIPDINQRRIQVNNFL